MENPTIQEIFNEWNDHRLELKKISSATHLRNRQIFNRHYGEFGRKRIKSVTNEDFRDFLEEQIPQHDLTSKAFSNLKIRKTYGTILLDNHIDNKLIIGQMGHTDIACTENHYHRNRKSIDKKSQIISNIPDFMAK